MSNLTVIATDLKETESLLREALVKEKVYLQIGMKKTQNRIRMFEDKYSTTLDQIIDQKIEIDHTDLAEWEGEVEILKRLIKKWDKRESVL